MVCGIVCFGDRTPVGLQPDFEIVLLVDSTNFFGGFRGKLYTVF